MSGASPVKLKVKVFEASGLKPSDPNGKADPYCLLNLGSGDNKGFKTEVRSTTLNPRWDEEFTFQVQLDTCVYYTDNDNFEVFGYLLLDVWDHDTVNPDDFMGRVLVPLRFLPLGSKVDEWFPLTQRNAKESVNGSLHLSICLSLVSEGKTLDCTRLDNALYEVSRGLGFHLKVLSGKGSTLEFPGRTERVEMAFSNVFVEVNQFHCTAQIYLTNYRLVILDTVKSTPGSAKHSTNLADLCMWISLKNIMATELSTENLTVRSKQSGSQHNIQSMVISITCYDFRNIRLTFVPPHHQWHLSKRGGGGGWLQEELGTTEKIFYKTLAKMASVQPPRKILRNMACNVLQAAASAASRNSGGGSSGNYKDRESQITASMPAKTDKDGLQRCFSDSKTVLSDKEKLVLSRRRHSEQALTAPQQMRGVNHCVSLDGNQTATVVEEGEVYDMLDELDRPDKPDKLVRPDELEELDEPDESDEPDELDDLDEDFELLDNLLNPLVPELDSIVVLPSLTPAMMVLHDSPAGRKKSVVDLSSAVPILKKQVPQARPPSVYVLFMKLEHIVYNTADFPPAHQFLKLYEDQQENVGWDLYNFPKEMDRQNISHDVWRITAINGPEYNLTPTYPQLLFVPNETTDQTLTGSALFRSKGRLPSLVWVNKDHGNFMMRSAQPLAGTAGKHSTNDETYLEEALRAGPSGSHIVVFDARSFSAAAGNRFMGKGTENVSRYKEATLLYLDIPNIHAVRESFDGLRSLCLSPASDKWFSLLEGTQWLAYVSLILKSAIMITRYMRLKRDNVLIHCSDGWDRTSQLTSLSQLMMDPYYRTIDGFIVLVEKEWLSFGHKFRQRLGHPNYLQDRSPVFLQFLDCIHQLLNQHPSAFEFNMDFLLTIADHLNMAWFGTFLCDSDMERHDCCLLANTLSLWAHILAEKSKFLNPKYVDISEPIVPVTNIRRLRLWEEYFLRYDFTGLFQDSRLLERSSDTNQLSSHSGPLSEDTVVWMANEKAAECCFCQQRFSAFKRKHHCRACGRIFCHNCSRHSLSLPKLGYIDPVRVCDHCFRKEMHPS